MLKEFYDFIAKRINRYFLEISAEGALQKGESFYLKLDDLDTVQKVADAIKDLATKGDNCGEYEYQCMDGSVYRTFTLKVIDNEIIIAAQINNMTNDFLCATLRNAANVVGKPLLMISSNPIDSAKSGSVDMAANGMPFYADNLMKEIRKMAEENTQLSTLEKRILDFELKRRDSDVFSDKTSLYEYKDLLSIMSSGSIKKENYPGFRLFSVEGKTDYQNEGKTQIDKKIKESKEIEKLEIRIKKLEKVHEELKRYSDALEEGIIEYKKKIISDIEPLLHVYTAKILQQKFNGKSIYISTNEAVDNIQFVNSMKDKQDILYSMSSGQLSAVAISFLLCMNQVYGKNNPCSILLIDDPVQTIDDVNMVGLVDLLRYEFEDRQIFISTHEQTFEWFLRYRYSKANKAVKIFNMKEIMLNEEA